jgi:hypothetical protein
MHQLRKSLPSILVSSLLLLLLTPVCFANPIFYQRSWQSIGWSVTVVFLLALSLTTIVESTVVHLFLQSPMRLWWRVLAAVGLINLITLVPAQAAWWYLNYEIGEVITGKRAVVPIVLVEFMVTVAEVFLLRWRLGVLFRQGFLHKPISNHRIVGAAVAANIASFVVGYLALEEANLLVSLTWLR